MITSPAGTTEFSHPCGTRADAGEYPALKRRAIIGLSRWDERGRIPNAAGAAGRGACPVKYGGDNGKPWRGHYFTGLAQ